MLQPLPQVINTRKTKMPSHANNGLYFFQQMQLPSVMPILVLGLAQYTSMLLAALAERLTLLTAPKPVLVSTVCVATQKMLE